MRIIGIFIINYDLYYKFIITNRVFDNSSLIYLWTLIISFDQKFLHKSLKIKSLWMSSKKRNVSTKHSKFFTCQLKIRNIKFFGFYFIYLEKISKLNFLDGSYREMIWLADYTNINELEKRKNCLIQVNKYL